MLIVGNDSGDWRGGEGPLRFICTRLRLLELYIYTGINPGSLSYERRQRADEQRIESYPW
jgi:hypothetical protein